jgi:hypothetical protein
MNVTLLTEQNGDTVSFSRPPPSSRLYGSEDCTCAARASIWPFERALLIILRLRFCSGLKAGAGFAGDFSRRLYSFSSNSPYVGAGCDPDPRVGESG